MKTPQVVMIVLIICGILIEIVNHGKLKDVEACHYNGWRGFISALITVALLWWGGFWK